MPVPSSRRPNPQSTRDLAAIAAACARFPTGGADAMPDYELLELALFAALPRGDTKPLAKALHIAVHAIW
jgi:DNA repair protein RadC